MIDYNDMKDKIEEIGYYATEELLYDTYNALYMIDEEEKQTGQDIYAICLEGPPGAGKTAFAKTYTEICKKMVDDKTEMISYQCDATTGKTELFEDINVSAAITRDGSKVNIPGKLVEAIKKAGYEPGKDIVFAMDAAASELYHADKGCYYFEGEGTSRSADEMIEYYKELCEHYPIVSIEDGLDEEDWEGWKKLTEVLGEKVQLVGDDLFVTNVKRLKCGIDMKVANSILIKINQIGTLTEAFHAIDMARSAGYTTVISHRSGETEDAMIADIAVAVNAGQIKTGAPCRAERTAKYNELLRIEEELDGLGRYEGI